MVQKNRKKSVLSFLPSQLSRLGCISRRQRNIHRLFYAKNSSPDGYHLCSHSNNP
ncbi:hypothetical protein CRYUN_Cryun33cG0023200 [Craigia yunnanensis]